MNDWPSTASPTLPPKCCLYYGRDIGGVVQEVFAIPYRETWQLGAVLNEVLSNENVEHVDYHDTWVMRFDLVTSRDVHGECLSRRRMWARSFMHNLVDCMNEGKRFKGRIPWHAEAPVRFLQGLPPRSLRAYDGQGEPEGVLGRQELIERAPRRTSASRASREGLISLSQLCEGSKMQPTDVRAMLRKRGIQKPAAGWVFEEGDQLIEKVRDIIRTGK